MEFFKVLDQFAGSLERILKSKERSNKRSHALTVFREDSLEYSKVELSHFEDNLVENLRYAFVTVILGSIKYWRLKGFHNHVISVDNFLGEDHKK
jgi:hypothetical protein